MTPSTLNSLTIAADFFKRQMTRYQRDFSKEPNAHHWQVLTRSMLAYQQTKYAIRSSSVDRVALTVALAAAPLGEWEDIVCRATLGMTAAAALA
jgi:hypothetical protein